LEEGEWESGFRGRDSTQESTKRAASKLEKGKTSVQASVLEKDLEQTESEGCLQREEEEAKGLE